MTREECERILRELERFEAHLCQAEADGYASSPSPGAPGAANIIAALRAALEREAKLQTDFALAKKVALDEVRGRDAAMRSARAAAEREAAARDEALEAAEQACAEVHQRLRVGRVISFEMREAAMIGSANCLDAIRALKETQVFNEDQDEELYSDREVTLCFATDEQIAAEVKRRKAEKKSKK